jgi:alpha-L-fucosidase 2
MQKHLVAVAVGALPEVDMGWKDGQLVQATIRANRDGEFRIYAQDKLSKVISLKKGQSKVWPRGI